MKFIAPLKGSHKKFSQCTAIDDCTRLRVLRIYDRLNQMVAIQFVDYVLQKLPFHVEAIQTDNGSEFQAAFRWHLLDRGVRHIYSKPRTPRLNGKVERSQRIDAEEFYRMLKGVVVDQSRLFTTKLQEWEDFYNSIVRMVASADRRRTNDCAKRSRSQMSNDIVSRTGRGWWRESNP